LAKKKFGEQAKFIHWQKLKLAAKAMVVLRDFFNIWYARGKFLSPYLLFYASFNFSKYSVFLQLIHFTLTLHFEKNASQHSKTLDTALC